MQPADQAQSQMAADAVSSVLEIGVKSAIPYPLRYHGTLPAAVRPKFDPR